MRPSIRLTSGKRRRTIPLRRQPFFRPWLEHLENRVAPATLTVNSFADNTTDTSQLTLRDAITLVNNGGNPASLGQQQGIPAGWASQISGTFGVNDTIQFAGSLEGQTITLSGSALTIQASVAIDGPGETLLTVSGSQVSGQGSAVFEVNGIAESSTVSLSGMSIEYGSGPGGGGVLDLAPVSSFSVSNCEIGANSGSSYGGLYIAADTAVVSNCIIAGNSDADGGAGIAADSGNLTVSNCVITNNTSSTDGGGIVNFGSLIVSDSALEENGCTSTGRGGRGIANFGTLQVNDSSLYGNYAVGGNGGGIENSGTAAVSDSTLQGNIADQNGYGGAIYSEGTLTVNTSTLAGNYANGPDALGGGVYVEVGGASATVTDSTVSGNAAGSAGGGLFNNSSTTLGLNGSIVAANSATYAPDADGNIFGFYNMVSNGEGLSGQYRIENGSDGNLVGLTASQVSLAPLGDWGGTTETMALLPGSLAIDAGAPGDLTPDQRGLPVYNGVRDIGAFESQGFTIAVSSGSGQSAAVNTSLGQPLTATVTANNPSEPVNGGVVTFTAPATGASATLSANTAVISGGSTSVTATANSTIGSYVVTATATGAGTPADFSLTNNPLAGTYVVTTTADSGPGSLRQAILDADAYEAANAELFDQAYIMFDIPTSDSGHDASTGAWTIAPASPLPALTGLVFIDARTQPGYAGVPMIELNGAGVNGQGAGANSADLTVSSGTVTVIVSGMTLTTAAAAPTILVTGGTLELGQDDVESSTGGDEACVALNGGTLNLQLGAAGGNVFNINGTGTWFANTTAGRILLGGDETFEINGVAQSVAVWLGADNNGEWDDANNWYGDQLPGPNDVAVITQAGITVTHDEAVNDSVYGIQSEAALTVSGGSLTLAGPSVIANLLLDSGTLVTNGGLTVTGPASIPFSGRFSGTYGLVLDGATLGGSGTVTVDTPSVLTWDPVQLNVSLVNNSAAINAGILTLGAGVTVTNAANASLEVLDNSQILQASGSSGAQLVNDGTITRQTTGYFGQDNVIGVPLTNASTGTVDVAANGLTLAAVANSGTITGASGTSIDFYGAVTTTSTSTIQGYNAEFDNAAVLSGLYAVSDLTNVFGDVTFSGCTVQMQDSQVGVDGGTFDLTGATLTAPLSLDDVDLTSGTLLVNGGLTVTGPASIPFSGRFSGTYGLVLDGATLGGSGTVTVDTPSVLTWDPVQLNVSLVNNSAAINAGILTLGAGVTVTNAANASLEVLDSSQILQASGSSGAQLVNDGTITRQTTGYFGQDNVIGVPLTNTSTGTVDVAANGLTLAAVANSGTIVGQAGTQLDVGGTLTLTPTGMVNAYQIDWGMLVDQIAGAAPGNGYGQITIGSSTTLVGALSLEMENGYLPAPGSFFNIVEPKGNAAIQGAFTDGPTVSAPGVQADGWSSATLFSLGYNNGVELTSLGSLTAAPNQYTVTASGFQRATNTGTYTSPAGAVTLSASLGTVVNNGNGSWSWSYNPDNGPTQTQTVTITATDPDGNVASTTFSLTTEQAQPTASLSGPSGGVLYQRCAFTLGANDTAPIDQAGAFTYAVNWGDGSSATIVGPSSAVDTHAYGSPGTYTVTLTATDQDGIVSAPVSEQVVVVATPQVQNGVLAVPGTASAAIITLTPVLPTGATTYSMDVSYTVGSTTTKYGPFTVTMIDVYGGPSDGDAVTLKGAANGNAFTVGNGTITELAAATTSFTVDLNTIASTTLAGTGSGDTLTGPNQANAWTINGKNAGTLNGAIAFTGIQNLTGGSVQDTFAFDSGGSIAGSLAGTAPANTLDFAPYGSSVTVNLQTTKATAIGGTWSNIQSFTGTDTTDTVVAANTTNSWAISGLNTGSVDGVSFAGFSNLTGGSADDTFAFLPGGSIAGNLSGAAPINTLDYSGYGSPATVNLGAKTATGIGGTWTGLEDFIGTNTSDMLIGATANSTWSITGTNAGTVGAYSFAGFSNLTGGTASDNFKFVSPGTLTGTINGGGGNDTITGDANGDSFTSTGSNAGAIASILANGFSNIENLTGGTGNNTFAFVGGGSIAGNLSGGSGTNTLADSGYGSPVTVNLAAKTATGIGGTWTKLTTFIGTDTSDVLIGANTTSTWSIAGTDSGTVGTIAFTGFPNLQGGTAGNDTFTFASGASVSGTVTGAPNGTNTLDLSGFGSPVTVNLQMMTATGIGGTWANIQNFKGTDTADTLSGPDATNNAWVVKTTNAGTVNGLAFTGFANLVGGSGNDMFTFANNATVSGHIDGRGGNNTLDDSAYTGGVTVNLGDATTDLASNAATGVAGGAANGIANIDNVVVGAGNNYLTAVGVTTSVMFTATGNGTNILIGGSGTNTLTATGAGDNMLIGGHGSATINGGSGYNLLIGGYTVYDTISADLESILSVWKTVKSAATYAKAIAELMASSNANPLTAGTVSSNAGDALNAGFHLIDWYFAAAANEITEENSGETVTLC